MQAGSGPANQLTGGRLALVYAFLAALLIAPVLCITVPVLGDFPNHLARIHILESLATGSKLAAWYVRPGRLVPYQAMDVVVAALRPLLPLYPAGRVFVALCLLVPPAAAASLRYAVVGRVGLVPAAGFLISYNYLVSAGLLDYLFSAGLGVVLFAIWLATAGWPRWSRAALCGAGLALVFLGHAFAAVAYCILVAGDQIALVWHRRFQPPAEVAADLAAAAAQVLPCLVLAVGFGASGAFGAAPVTLYGNPSARLADLLTPILFPGPPWIFGLFGLPLLVGLALLASGRARLSASLTGPLAAITIATAAAPSVLLNAWATDKRLPIVLFIVLIAALVPARPVPRPILSWAAVALVILVAARSATAFVLLQSLDVQAAELRGLVTGLPVGSRLLVVDDDEPTAPLRLTLPVITDHLGLLATIDRDAFVPFLLTGATPIDVRPAFAAAASPNGGAITTVQLRDGATRHDNPGAPLPYGYGGHVYWLDWHRKFDYLLIMGFGSELGPLPKGLFEVGRVPIAALYRVVQQ
jgi:hypothetical protein